MQLLACQVTSTPQVKETSMADFQITPPPELVQQWFAAWESSDNEEMSFAEFAIPSAAQWGADQELEACCEWMRNASFGLSVNTSSYQLRAARRRKAPSLKELALEAFDRINDPEGTVDWDTIRRALEALPDD
jgi:hypothetical protein